MAFVAPDVGITTNVGGIIAATGVFDANPQPDFFRFLTQKKSQQFRWRLTREGQFHSIAINEGLAALLAYAFGRQKFAIEGKESLIPIVTIYDVFWKHAYTQLYYALYDGARFIAVGTPSGTSLSRESATHQSIQTPAMFMGLPNISCYEPAFEYDARVIYHWAIQQLVSPQGEAVYLRLTTQELDQLPIQDSPSIREQIVRGAYWVLHWRGEPGDDPRTNVAHVFATDLLEDPNESYHLNDIIAPEESFVPAVVAGDFSPQVAEWLSGALDKYVPVLGPRGFSETGDVNSIRRLHGFADYMPQRHK
jgi:pyruvate dehydrogenase E1 component